MLSTKDRNQLAKDENNYWMLSTEHSNQLAKDENNH